MNRTNIIGFICDRNRTDQIWNETTETKLRFLGLVWFDFCESVLTKLNGLFEPSTHF